MIRSLLSSNPSVLQVSEANLLRIFQSVPTDNSSADRFTTLCRGWTSPLNSPSTMDMARAKAASDGRDGGTDKDNVPSATDPKLPRLTGGEPARPCPCECKLGTLKLIGDDEDTANFTQCACTGCGDDGRCVIRIHPIVLLMGSRVCEDCRSHRQRPLLPKPSSKKEAPDWQGRKRRREDPQQDRRSRVPARGGGISA